MIENGVVYHHSYS